MTGTMQDISEIKQYQQELERSNQDLEQFAFIASHDLQEPLRKVASFCSLLREEYSEELGENGNTYVDFAVDGAIRMRSLVQDLLAYSTIGSGSEENSTVSVEAAFESAVNNLSSAIEESDAVITHESLPTIVAREREIAQLLQNLIGNSIKYRSEKVPKIHLGVREEDNFWVFSITDNGIGISPEFREQIFGIFKRLHTREKFVGTGIGLSICQRVVEKIGGKIWVDDTDHGTRICFSVPMQMSHSTIADNQDEPAAIEQHA
jgi:light-regulated signal transduction histidine kinase (bacteriophytochrome)